MPKVDLTISALSKQYLKVPVAAVVNGAPYNPTLDPVSIACVPHGTEPDDPAQFHAGDWEILVNGNYNARLLIGPGSLVVLTDGFYDVYVKVTSAAEIPVIYAGVLQIT